MLLLGSSKASISIIISEWKDKIRIIIIDMRLVLKDGLLIVPAYKLHRDSNIIKANDKALLTSFLHLSISIDYSGFFFRVETYGANDATLQVLEFYGTQLCYDIQNIGCHPFGRVQERDT